VLGSAGYGVLLISMLLAPLVTAFASGESTHFIVSVYVDGSARWVVEHRYPLRSEEDVEAFRAVATSGASAALLMRRRGSVGVQESGFREIIEVLRRHGGEVPQHVIVEETGLSKASVSMMLKALEASGVVVRVKSGKTKVVRLVK
jgi:DNA-binding transcriptional ArsR family regulator